MQPVGYTLPAGLLVPILQIFGKRAFPIDFHGTRENFLPCRRFLIGTFQACL